MKQKEGKEKTQRKRERKKGGKVEREEEKQEKGRKKKKRKEKKSSMGKLNPCLHLDQSLVGDSDYSGCCINTRLFCIQYKTPIAERAISPK